MQSSCTPPPASRQAASCPPQRPFPKMGRYFSLLHRNPQPAHGGFAPPAIADPRPSAPLRGLPLEGCFSSLLPGDTMPPASRWARRMTETESSRVPLFLQSCFSGWVWLLLGLVLAAVGGLVLTAGLRAPVTMAPTVTGMVLAALGCLAFLRGLTVATGRIEFSPDGVCRASCIGRPGIAWPDVNLFSSGLETQQRPFHARFRIESEARVLSFRTRPDWFGHVDGWLKTHCPRAFVLIDATGEIEAPATGDGLEFRQRFGDLSLRTSRRFRWTGVLQLGLLPLLGVLWVAAAFGGVAFWGCMPIGLSSIGANFRKARNARRSFERFVEAESPAPRR